MEALTGFSIAIRISLVNADQASSSSDSLNITGNAVMRGSVITLWTWSGPSSLTLPATKPSFQLVTYGSSVLGIINTTSFSTSGVHEQALRRSETSGSLRSEFVGCQSGTFGTYLCTPCGSGSFSLRTGDVLPLSCSECSPGEFQNAQGQPSCKPCPAGTFEASAGSAGCGYCAPGHVQGSAGAQSCDQCPPGHYSPVPGGQSCLQCTPGRQTPNVAPHSSPLHIFVLFECA